MSSNGDQARFQGRFAEEDFAAVYGALDREVHRLDQVRDREIARVDGLRQADQISLAAALTAAKTAVDAALAAAEKAVAAALIAAKEAVNKAELAQQRTNEGQNEFRGQLKDQANTLLPRTEYVLAHAALEDKVESNRQSRAESDDGLQKQISDLRSRLDQGPPSLAVLQQRSDEQAGAKKGSEATLGTIIAIASAAAVIGGAIGGFILNTLPK